MTIRTGGYEAGRGSANEIRPPKTRNITDDARTRVAKAINQEMLQSGEKELTPENFRAWWKPNALDLADAAIAAMAEPEPDPYTELIDDLADAASDAFPINHSASDKDDWRNVVKAVIDGLREGAEDKLAIALWGATPTREDNWVVMRRCVDAILPKEPKA